MGISEAGNFYGSQIHNPVMAAIFGTGVTTAQGLDAAARWEAECQAGSA